MGIGKSGSKMIQQGVAGITSMIKKVEQGIKLNQQVMESNTKEVELKEAELTAFKSQKFSENAELAKENEYGEKVIANLSSLVGGVGTADNVVNFKKAS